MIHFIKEAFQVDVHDVCIPLVNILLCLQYCLMGVSIGPETVTVFFELLFELNGDDLRNCLLQQPVGYCWNAQ